MTSLFGAPMDTIMAVMLGTFILVSAVVAVLALRNRLLFKLGLRNIPRRRAQTILIIVGLMLSTVIITSAFGTGDTVSYSIRSSTVTSLGAIDETITSAAGSTYTGGANSSFSGATSASTYLPARVVRSIVSTFSTNKNVDGVTPVVTQGAPLQDLTSGQTKAGGALAGIPTNYASAFGSLHTTDGRTVTLGQLGPEEVYINQKAGNALSAHAGDTLRVFIGAKPVTVHVRAIVRNENLAAGGLPSGGQQSDPLVLLPLDRVQRLLGHPGAVTTVLVSNRGDAQGGVSYSDDVTSGLRALLANTKHVATARALLHSQAGTSALAKLVTDQVDPKLKKKLQDLQAQVALPTRSDTLKGLLSDPAVMSALKTIKAPAVAGPLNDALASISDYSVQPLKQQGLDAADLFGSLFTSIFVIFGLFSISAGIMLIFLIFVMLAAERRAEMGMARAVGTKRRHLIQQFLFEGYAYNLGAALVGIVLGIGVGLVMVKIMASLLGAADFTLKSHIEPRSVVVAFCLGALVTFITVAVSSWRVSRLNIVAAIRDLPEEFGIRGGVGVAFRRPLTDLANVGRRLRRGRILGALAALLAAPWHFITAWRVFIGRGPLLVLVGYLLAAQGIHEKSEFFFGIGASLLLIGTANLLRWIMGAVHVPDAIRNRIGFSLAGLSLVIFWLLPDGALKRFGVPDLTGGIEMFFVSGILLVMGGVWTVMYNSDLLLAGLMRVFGRRGHLAPTIKMAVTYPMQFKFRTGMTLAMFSLVIFTLMVMSVLIGSSSTSLKLGRDTGGYQIYGAVNPNNPIQHIGRGIKANPTLRDGIAATGGLSKIAISLRQPGQQDQSWQPYGANILDDGYLGSTQYTLHARANGFGSDRQVWQTLRDKPGYAVVDSSLIPFKSGGDIGGGTGFTVSGFHYEDKSFKPATIEMRDGGTVIRLTVIGVLDHNAANLNDLTSGVYTGESTLVAADLPPAQPNTYVFRVTPGTDVHTIALALGKTFLRNGLDVKEAQKQFDTNQSINIGLNNLLQAFMALGLVVGIAALGVVATRSVVERRQQIGMMRAIGFQRGMIRTSFLLESSFVAILGSLLGVVLGVILAHNLVESFAKNDPSVVFTVPWTQIGLIVVLTYLASLLTTYLPAWQASRVYPAEALRYE